MSESTRRAREWRSGAGRVLCLLRLRRYTCDGTSKGDHIQCRLDDKLLLDVKDTTFKDAGQIGLWTKADAQTRFAGLRVAGE